MVLTPSSILFDITANVFDGIKVGDVVCKYNDMVIKLLSQAIDLGQ